MKNITDNEEIREEVREHYGQIARDSTRGCGCGSGCSDVEVKACSPSSLGYDADDLASVPEGSEMGLGCGNPVALTSIRPGETVVDLGSGGGFDCFLAAKRTGPKGRVIGVDMTPDMISKARRNAAKGGCTNVEFRVGEIENLPIADNTADLIISNCVINLSPDKPRVFEEAFRVLKPGGCLSISDIVALRPLPEKLKSNFVAYTGCVADAESVQELKNIMRRLGFEDVRIEIKESSHRLFDEAAPGAHGGDYIASANITAYKPEVMACLAGECPICRRVSWLARAMRALAGRCAKAPAHG